MGKPSTTLGASAAPASPAGTYSISDTAEELKVDVKTVRNKIKALHLPTMPDPADRRARLLTHEQVLMLARHLTQNRNHRTGIIEMRADIAQRSPDYTFAQALDIVRAKEEELAMREARLTEQEQKLDARLDLFVKAFDKLTASIDSRLKFPRESRGAHGTTARAAAYAQ